jgi:Ca2+/Na+ antiporter
MSYLIGNLLGRAIISYLLVLLVWTLVSRFDMKKALRSSVRWFNWVLVVLLTFLGLAVHVGGA